MCVCGKDGKSIFQDVLILTILVSLYVYVICVSSTHLTHPFKAASNFLPSKQWSTKDLSKV